MTTKRCANPLQWLLESAGLAARTFHSAEEFLGGYPPHHPGCLVLDIRMRGMDGLELQSRLAEHDITLPVIMLTGHGDIAMAVRAVKLGALDFLEKPVHDQLLVQCVRAALELDARRRAQRQQARDIAARLDTLTPREREVMNLVVTGKANKQIAAELQVTEKTIEVHRKRVMQKMGVRSAVALAQLIMGGRNDTPPAGAGSI